MKIIFKAILVVVVLVFFTDCAKEPMIKVNPDYTLSFQRDGKADASAGVTFYVIPSGTGEFLTLFNGTPGHVYGEVGAKGKDFDKADSLAVTYGDAGKYKMTILSSSSGSFGKDFSTEAKTLEVNVIDERNSITGFFIKDVAGKITKDNEILFTIPDITTDFNFKPIFITASSLSTVVVNGVAQESGVTQNDFAQPVVYSVKSATGAEKQYTVKFSTYPSSTEKKIIKFALGYLGNGEIGVIDETNKTINITANYGTDFSKVRLVIEYSFASKVLINGNTDYSDRTAYNLATVVKTIKVIAEDKSEVVYTLKTVSEKDPVLSFTFAGQVPEQAGVINTVTKSISLDVLKGTDVTKLAAKWTGSKGKVTIGSVIQTNGVTVNNFTSPLTYTFYKGSTSGDKYVVTVNIK